MPWLFVKQNCKRVSYSEDMQVLPPGRYDVAELVKIKMEMVALQTLWLTPHVQSPFYLWL